MKSIIQLYLEMEHQVLFSRIINGGGTFHFLPYGYFYWYSHDPLLTTASNEVTRINHFFSNTEAVDSTHIFCMCIYSTTQSCVNCREMFNHLHKDNCDDNVTVPVNKKHSFYIFGKECFWVFKQLWISYLSVLDASYCCLRQIQIINDTSYHKWSIRFYHSILS